MLINLDQSEAFDRVDHSFLEAVLFFGRFRVIFSQVDSPSLCVPRICGESERSKVETLHFDLLVRQGCLFYPKLESFWGRLKANPVLYSLTLLGSTEVAGTLHMLTTLSCLWLR